MSNGEASPYAASYTPMVSPTQRPSGRTAVGVLCIVGGIMGILVGLFTLSYVFFGAAFGSAFITPGPMEDAQREMQTNTQLVASRFFVANLISGLLTVVVGTCLLVGGIGIFRVPPWGRMLIRRTLLLAIVLECLKGCTYIMTQLEMMPIMEVYMHKMMTKPGGAAPPAAVGSMMKVMTFIGMGMWLLWAALKLGLYVWGFVYLRKPYATQGE